LQGNYTNQNHWGGLSAEANHVGAEGPQGFLYYYFFALPIAPGGVIHRGRGGFIDKCVYNSNLMYCTISNVVGGKVYIVHKPTFKVPRQWFNKFLDAVKSGGASASSVAGGPDRGPNEGLGGGPRSASDESFVLSDGMVHVIQPAASRETLVHCNLGERVLSTKLGLDDVLERHGWPWQRGAGVHGKGLLRYVRHMHTSPSPVLFSSHDNSDLVSLTSVGFSAWHRDTVAMFLLSFDPPVDPSSIILTIPWPTLLSHSLPHR